jgi:hypothetical protein
MYGNCQHQICLPFALMLTGIECITIVSGSFVHDTDLDTADAF